MYKKPILMATEDMSEGIYAASGANTITKVVDCWTVTATLKQINQVGRMDRRIQIVCAHASVQGHQPPLVVTVTFNNPVENPQCGGATPTLTAPNVVTLTRNQPVNPNESVGLGDLVVWADDSLLLVDIDIHDTH